MVAAEHEDITEGTYSHTWEVDPLLYQGLRVIGYRDMSDLVGIVERISHKGVGNKRAENSG